MKKLFSFTILSFLFMVGVASASTFSFDGNITYHNDIIEIDFALDANTTDVTVWTDSFLSGINFDPITAVWQKDGSVWTLVGENDDDDSLWAGQTYYDSGLFFSSLDAGEYKFTIATYSNFAAGSTLSAGFEYDAQTPILMSEWDQPASDFGMGTYYRVNLDGVDSAIDNTNPGGGSSTVPEPTTMLLLGLGLLGFAGVSRKKTA